MAILSFHLIVEPQKVFLANQPSHPLRFIISILNSEESPIDVFKAPRFLRFANNPGFDLVTTRSVDSEHNRNTIFSLLLS